VEIIGRGAAVTNVLVIDGEILATWSRTFKKSEVEITVDPFGRLTAAQRPLIRAAADALGRFLGLTPRLVVR